MLPTHNQQPTTHPPTCDSATLRLCPLHDSHNLVPRPHDVSPAASLCPAPIGRPRETDHHIAGKSNKIQRQCPSWVCSGPPTAPSLGTPAPRHFRAALGATASRTRTDRPDSQPAGVDFGTLKTVVAVARNRGVDVVRTREPAPAAPSLKSKLQLTPLLFDRSPMKSPTEPLRTLPSRRPPLRMASTDIRCCQTGPW